MSKACSSTISLELTVLALELYQPLRFRNIHPVELRLPSVERLLDDVMQTAGFSDIPDLFSPVQHSDGLLFGKLLALGLASNQPERLTQRLDSASQGWPITLGRAAVCQSDLVLSDDCGYEHACS